MIKKNILITGGAGYIGSLTVKRLFELGYNIYVIDNLSKGRKELIENYSNFSYGDILDLNFLEGVFKVNRFDVIIHFAADKDAGESMINPEKYSKNIIGTINILNLMVKYNIPKIIFSSSAAVYGLPKKEIITEEHELKPINFYGFSKLKSEELIQWFSKLKNINYVILRYFNVAGEGGLNYIDPNASNIFPIICEVLSGKRERLKIFGNDYNTKDGTCIRDYIHILDLVEAHILALNLNENEILNLGTSKGYSVFDLVKSFEKILSKKINYEFVSRRIGDPEMLVTSNEKAKKVLNWDLKYNLDDMIKSTWNVYKNDK